jgi:GNAT superfamily N-acetyltransferase
MLSIRPATINDVPSLAILIRELAEYEKLSHEVTLTADDLARDGFGKTPKFSALIAESDSQLTGYAIFFPIYSTFKGRSGLFVEDAYVRPAFRGQGIGRALFAHIARVCRSSGFSYMRWEVLDWNAPAINFYEKMGVTFLDQWKSAALLGDALDRLANGAAKS